MEILKYSLCSLGYLSIYYVSSSRKRSVRFHSLVSGNTLSCSAFVQTVDMLFQPRLNHSHESLQVLI